MNWACDCSVCVQSERQTVDEYTFLNNKSNCIRRYLAWTFSTVWHYALKNMFNSTLALPLSLSPSFSPTNLVFILWLLFSSFNIICSILKGSRSFKLLFSLLTIENELNTFRDVYSKHTAISAHQHKVKRQPQLDLDQQTQNHGSSSTCAIYFDYLPHPDHVSMWRIVTK